MDKNLFSLWEKMLQRKIVDEIVGTKEKIRPELQRVFDDFEVGEGWSIKRKIIFYSPYVAYIKGNIEIYFRPQEPRFANIAVLNVNGVTDSDVELNNNEQKKLAQLIEKKQDLITKKIEEDRVKGQSNLLKKIKL